MNYLKHLDSHNQAFKFLDDHIRKCTIFLNNFTCIYNSMNISDKIKVVANAIHPLRLLQLANSESDDNYFNLDDESFGRLTHTFPVFSSSLDYLNAIRDYIRALKLDAKEFALFSALLVFSSGKLN